MSKSDWKHFNCQEKHEIEYVVGLYPKDIRDKVTEAIKDLCANNKNMTHEFLYAKLEEKGFFRL